MKKQMVLLMLFVLLRCYSTEAQTLTVDPLMAGAISVASSSENNSYKDIKNKQTSIQALQTATVSMIQSINNIQQKVYNGLLYVSNAAQTAYQVFECLQQLNDVYYWEKLMINEAGQNPLALAFAVKVQNEMVTKAVAYYGEISSMILKQGDTKLLMDAGERQQLVYHVLLDLRILSALASYSYYLVHQAVMEGIIKTLNPFNGFVDVDKKIVKNILVNWKH